LVSALPITGSSDHPLSSFFFPLQYPQESSMRRVLTFDMNGTLLDISALDGIFADHFETHFSRREWFDELIKLSMVATITGQYADFSVLGKAALSVIAQRHHKQLTSAAETQIMQTVRTLPAFPDVKPGLQKLKDAGYRLVVMTNSPLASAQHSIKNAGLDLLFEKVMSVEAVKKFKPAADVYQHAAKECGIAINDLMMVAAHAWDTTGALRAGAHAAFVKRPDQVLDPESPKPDLIVNDMEDLAAQLLGEPKQAGESAADKKAEKEARAENLRVG
jgi:2-haloacid dehalogenase